MSGAMSAIRFRHAEAGVAALAGLATAAIAALAAARLPATVEGLDELDAAEFAMPRHQPADLALIAELDAARARCAGLWEEIAACRAEITRRVGERGAVIGSFVTPDGRTVPIWATNKHRMRRLFGQLPGELADYREAARKAVAQASERWDAEAALVRLPEMVKRAKKMGQHARALEVRVAAQLRISEGAQA